MRRRAEHTHAFLIANPQIAPILLFMSNRNEDWSARTLRELMEHIVLCHHAFTRDALSAIVPLAHEVAREHGGRHPHLVEVVGLLRALDEDLRDHLAAEERFLFPFIEELDIASRTPGARERSARIESIDGPLRAMLFEHDHAGDVLRALRATTNDYATPEDASAAYRALSARLVELEEDLVHHMTLEREILIPRARALAGISSIQEDPFRSGA